MLPRLSLPSPAYFDTFRMEMMLDRMRTITDALDKMNHLRQIDRAAVDRAGAVERIGESLEVAKAFLADTKAERKIDTLSGIVAAAQQFTDPDSLMQNAGSLLSAFSSLGK